jgi:uncharacterized iron-regulated membrane protein
MVKKLVGKIHLWLGLSVGLIVVFLGITGCLLAFQREIESFTQPYAYVKAENKECLQPSELGKIAQAALPGKMLHSVTYGEKGSSAQVAFYQLEPEEYYYIAYINPYSGEVLKVKNMDRDFFRILIDGHFYLWLPPHIGQPIVASATLIFVIMMITGIILWWPRNKAARKQRFKIKWNARWRRVNYDLHNVFGFYMSWVAIFIALTGLVFGFQWFAKAVYWTTSGGKQLTEFYEPVAQKAIADSTQTPAIDRIYAKMKAEYITAETIEVHYPINDSVAIGAGANPDAGTYWQIDYRWFDQRTLQEVEVNHLYGRFGKTSTADKIARMNYDVHVGAIGGITTKIIAFFASLIAASLPITGFYIWWGRRKKKIASKKQEAMNVEIKPLQAI